MVSKLQRSDRLIAGACLSVRTRNAHKVYLLNVDSCRVCNIYDVLLLLNDMYISNGVVIQSTCHVARSAMQLCLKRTNLGRRLLRGVLLSVSRVAKEAFMTFLT